MSLCLGHECSWILAEQIIVSVGQRTRGKRFVSPARLGLAGTRDMEPEPQDHDTPRTCST